MAQPTPDTGAEPSLGGRDPLSHVPRGAWYKLSFAGASANVLPGPACLAQRRFAKDVGKVRASVSSSPNGLSERFCDPLQGLGGPDGSIFPDSLRKRELSKSPLVHAPLSTGGIPSAISLGQQYDTSAALSLSALARVPG